MSEQFEKWVSPCGRATLICGDCLDVLPTLDAGSADACVTDPPYGVNGGSGTIGRLSGKTKYSGSFDDTEEYIVNVVVPALKIALKIAKRAVVTPGNPNLFHYPKPFDIGMIFQPATTGLNKWGRETMQPILFYGKDPMAGKTILPKHITNTTKAEESEHPCPKPLHVAEWMVMRGSLRGEIVIDPFMGSGTTGVAAIKLNRRFIGIEIDPGYFEIAKSRIIQALADKDNELPFAEPDADDVEANQLDLVELAQEAGK